MKICFLVSGSGGNLKFFHLGCKEGIFKNLEFAVIADRECNALAYAKHQNLYSKQINYSQDYNDELFEELQIIAPDIIVTTWHKVIDSKIVTIYDKRMINLHYSLLPNFSKMIGVAPIQKALDCGCKYVGPTCHYVDDNLDGGKIIAQALVRAELGFENVITNVFRKGCLILCNSLLVISHHAFMTKQFNTKFEYSPYLEFDDELFTESFWEKLSGL